MFLQLCWCPIRWCLSQGPQRGPRCCWVLICAIHCHWTSFLCFQGHWTATILLCFKFYFSLLKRGCSILENYISLCRIGENKIYNNKSRNKVAFYKYKCEQIVSSNQTVPKIPIFSPCIWPTCLLDWLVCVSNWTGQNLEKLVQCWSTNKKKGLLKCYLLPFSLKIKNVKYFVIFF